MADAAERSGPERLDRRDAAIGLALAAIVVALYGPTVGHGFVLLDDPMYVTGNARVQSGLSAAGARWAFTTLEASNWHPATWLSLMLDASLFGPGPAGFHATNVGLHAAAAILLFLALRAATGRRGPAGVVAGLFALHPAHVESVAWISERKDVLAAAFGMAALLAHVRFAQRGGAWRYLVVAVCMALGVLSKPSLVTWPCVLLLVDVWPLGRWPAAAAGRPGCRGAPGRAASPRQLLLEKLPLAAFAAFVSVATLQAQGAATATLGLDQRIANAVVAYARYLGRWVWPASLSPIDPHPALHGEGWSAAAVLGAACVLAALSFAAARTWRRAPYRAVGWLWFLGVLVPMIGLVQVGLQATADRYTYLAYVGLGVAACWSVDAWAGESSTRRRIALALALPIALSLAARTVQQVSVWRSSESLFRHAVGVTPDAPAALAGLASVLSTSGRADEARGLLTRALAVDPRHADALETAAYVAGTTGDLAGAIALQQRALAERDTPRARRQLGKLFESSRRDAEALRAYADAARRQPAHVENALLAARVAARLGDSATANAHWEAAHRRLEQRRADGVAPVATRIALGEVALGRGNAAEALDWFRDATELAPANASTWRGATRAALEAGEPDAALALAAQGRLQAGDDPETRILVIQSLAALGRRDAAIDAAGAFVREHPGHPLAAWAEQRRALLLQTEAPTEKGLPGLPDSPP